MAIIKYKDNNGNVTTLKNISSSLDLSNKYVLDLIGCSIKDDGRRRVLRKFNEQFRIIADTPHDGEYFNYFVDETGTIVYYGEIYLMTNVGNKKYQAIYSDQEVSSQNLVYCTEPTSANLISSNSKISTKWWWTSTTNTNDTRTNTGYLVYFGSTNIPNEEDFILTNNNLQKIQNDPGISVAQIQMFGQEYLFAKSLFTSNNMLSYRFFTTHTNGGTIYSDIKHLYWNPQEVV